MFRSSFEKWLLLSIVLICIILMFGFPYGYTSGFVAVAAMVIVSCIMIYTQVRSENS